MAEQVVFAGNPGVGKSTLLNSLVGSIEFRSGVSAGSGLTVRLQRVGRGNKVYVDTPGLFDTARIKQAAQEIEASLKLGGEYKIIFVVQLKAGRVKAEDITTMTLILKAAPIQQYGIIVNDVPKNTALKIQANVDNFWDNIKVQLISELPVKTALLHIIQREEVCVDEDDILISPPPNGLLDFLDSVPSIRILPDSVKEISVAKYEELQAELGASLQSFRDSEATREQMRIDLEQKLAEQKREREQDRRQREEDQRQKEIFRRQIEEAQLQEARARVELRVKVEQQEKERQRLHEDAVLSRWHMRQMEEQQQIEKKKRQRQAEELQQLQKKQSITEVQTSTCQELRSELKRKSCPTSGNKKTLVSRVVKQRGLQ